MNRLDMGPLVVLHAPIGEVSSRHGSTLASMALSEARMGAETYSVSVSNRGASCQAASLSATDRLVILDLCSGVLAAGLGIVDSDRDRLDVAPRRRADGRIHARVRCLFQATHGRIARSSRVCVRNWSVVFALLLALGYVTKTSDVFARTWAFAWYVGRCRVYRRPVLGATAG